MHLVEYRQYSSELLGAKSIFAERDGQIYKHLRESVFPGKRSALLRLICNFSKREAHLLTQPFKYTRRKDGSKRPNVYSWCYADDGICVARGSSGSVAVWVTCM